MNRESLMELLNNYRSYRYAIAQGVAPHQEDDTLGMPLGGSYGSRAPRLSSSGGSLLSSIMDYMEYKKAVLTLEGAVKDVLDDTEQYIIENRYMERNKLTFEKMVERKGSCEKTWRTIHKRALRKLVKAMQFVTVPEIHKLDGKVAFVHVPYEKIS